MTLSRGNLILLAALGSALLLGGAFVFQALGYAPCKLCIWQRWPHAAAIALGALGAFLPLAAVASAGALAAATTGGIGVYHAGVEWGFWEGPTSCTGGSLAGLSGASLLDPNAAGAVVMCDEVVWSLFGLSMAGWNALLSFGLALVWVAALLRPAGPGAGGRI
jgi:disulfide bond formation protein DsbB